MYEELQITHVHGPIDLGLPPDQAVVLCVVRNGEDYIQEFVQYYTSMGFRHMVFLDNGSADSTIRIAQRYENVTVLQSLSDFKKNKLKFKHALTTRFGRGTWSLIADIDEFFQYPKMDTVSLGAFINYLNKYKYTSVVANLLDLVPSATIKQLSENPVKSVLESDWYFSESCIEKRDYDFKSNIATNPNIKSWYGGIRKKLFDLDSVLLTKHPFNFGDGNMAILSNHLVGNRRVADVSGLLLHYKFVGNAYAKIRSAVREKVFYQDSIEYQHYLEKFENQKELLLAPPGCRKLTNHELLISLGLFEVSAQFRADFGPGE